MDKQPLHGWVTIREVSDTLGVQYHTIYRAVLKAHHFQEDWVKRETYPGDFNQLRWLIDTDHSTYQNRARRWQKLAKLADQHEELLPPFEGDIEYWAEDPTTLGAPLPLSEEHDECIPFMLSGLPSEDPYPSSSNGEAVDATNSWSELMHWLSEHGLVVFINALTADQSWSWTWGEYTSTGYPSVTAAVTAALKHRLLRFFAQEMPLPKPKRARWYLW